MIDTLLKLFQDKQCAKKGFDQNKFSFFIISGHSKLFRKQGKRIKADRRAVRFKVDTVHLTKING